MQKQPSTRRRIFTSKLDLNVKCYIYSIAFWCIETWSQEKKSEIPWQFSNVLLEKHEEDNLEKSCEKLKVLNGVMHNVCRLRIVVFYASYVFIMSFFQIFQFVQHMFYCRWDISYCKFSCVTHILILRHQFGSIQDNMDLITTTQKGMRMNCWESNYIQIINT
jgi:hypothetical protein